MLANKVQKVLIDSLIISNEIKTSILFDECDEIEIINLSILDSTVLKPVFIFNSIKTRISISNVTIQNIDAYAALFLFSNSSAAITLNNLSF